MPDTWAADTPSTIALDRDTGGGTLAEKSFKAAFVEDSICGSICRVFRVGTRDD